SKGYHIAFALDGKSDYGKVARFGHAVGRELVRRDPKNFTQEFYKSDRAGKILIDTGRNEFGATYAAPYAVRPRPTAPISAPCTWQELETGKASPGWLGLRGMGARLAETGDLWKGMLLERVPLPSI